MRVYIFFLLHEKNIARQKLHAIEINNLVLLIFFYILKSTQFPFLKKQMWPSCLSTLKRN